MGRGNRTAGYLNSPFEERAAHSVIDVDGALLSQIICASILLLVTAFVLGTPGLKLDAPSETTSLLRISPR